MEGTSSCPRWGYPILSCSGWEVLHPVLDGGTPSCPRCRYPFLSGGYPILSWPRCPSSEGTWDQWKYNGMEMGYLLERTWHKWKYCGMESGYVSPPLPGCELTNKLKTLKTVKIFSISIIFSKYSLLGTSLVQ